MGSPLKTENKIAAETITLPGALLQNASYSNPTNTLEMESQRFIEMSKRNEERKKPNKTQREYFIHQRWHQSAEGTYNFIVSCNAAADKRMQHENPSHSTNDRIFLS